MRLPTWSEVLAAPDHLVPSEAHSLAKARFDDGGWWAFSDEYVTDIRVPVHVVRMFALFCILAERDR